MKWYDWFFDVLKNKYATFEGRARRKEFWYFGLMNIIIVVGFSFIDGLLGTYSSNTGMGLLSGIYFIAILIPAIAVSVRRLHDSSLSGFWILLSFMPIVGAITLIILYVRDSTPEQNKYGPNPKTISA
jgi:uncharacterized membrane protein YhaH (DUF805 family)